MRGSRSRGVWKRSGPRWSSDCFDAGVAAMNQEDLELVVALTLKRIDEAEFRDQYSETFLDGRRHTLILIRDAVQEQDGDGLYAAFLFGYQFGFPEETRDLIRDVLLEEWHHQHEDFVQIVGEARDPSDVELFYQVSSLHLPYLAYNDSGALGSKAIYELRNIGTPEAKARVLERQEVEKRPLVVHAINSNLESWNVPRRK